MLKQPLHFHTVMLTLLMRGPNRPFRCLDSSRFSLTFYKNKEGQAFENHNLFGIWISYRLESISGEK